MQAKRDSEEIRRISGALQDSEATILAIVETAVDAIITIDECGRIESFNGAAERLFGYDAKQVKGENVSILMPLPYRSEHDGYMRRYLETGEKRIIGVGREVVGRRRDGTTFPMDLAVSEVALRGRRVFAGIVRDITERKRAEEALAAERELLAVTLRSIVDGVITTDIGGRVLLLSRMGERLTGWTQKEAEGKPVAEVFHILDHQTRRRFEDPVGEVLRTGSAAEVPRDAILVARDGSERRIDEVCAPLHDRDSRLIGAVIAFRDITERQRLEDELLRSQRLESLGILAGGLAHDFNNFLGEILVNINLAKMGAVRGTEALTALAGAEMASLRARDLTRQLVTFAKGGAPVKKLTSLRRLIHETIGLALSGSSVRCTSTIREDLWSVEADEGQLSQVLNNLIINAVQAMPDGGELHVEAENGQPRSAEHPAMAGSRHVRVTIRDTGAGIPAEHLEKVFDPYFTTKEHGTGLGLSMSYSIVKKHDGYISIESRPGQGTTVKLLLPASQQDAPAAAQETGTENQDGSGRVLLMEDSEGLREATAKMLRRLGYEVEAVRDGALAIERYQAARGAGAPFDVVIMDLTIVGGMGGKETIQHLRELDPGVRAIAASGYSTDPILANPQDYGFAGVIRKPFGRRELGEVLQSLMRCPD